jgi:hypothetical protein
VAYATTDHVQAALPGRTISASSKPTLAQVTAWIEEGDARLNAVLARAGVETPVEDAQALVILRSWTMLYAEGRTRMAFASGGGDGTNDDGKDLIAKFDELLQWIRENPTAAAAELSETGSAPDTSRRMRSHVLDNAHGLSVDNGDFDPKFTVADGGDQF